LTSERAGFPAIEQCRVCHASSDAKIPSSRVFKVPDFVFFSHARHGAKGVKCQSCHGDVWSADVLKPAPAINMKFCVDCHKTKGATIVCTACHELSQ
jgi:hypothetical protein